LTKLRRLKLGGPLIMPHRVGYLHYLTGQASGSVVKETAQKYSQHL